MDHEVSKIRETPVRVVRLTAECTCGGELKPSGMVLYTAPLKYAHYCIECGHVENIEEAGGIPVRNYDAARNLIS